MQIGRLFEKIHQQETNRKGKRGKEKNEKSDNEQDGNNLESDDEPDDKKVGNSNYNWFLLTGDIFKPVTFQSGIFSERQDQGVEEDRKDREQQKDRD